MGKMDLLKKIESVRGIEVEVSCWFLACMGVRKTVW
jgi:hypothetical protein